MKLKWCNALLLLVALLSLGSCLSPAKQAIFRGMEYDTRYKAVPPEELIIQKFDKLDILIRSDIPQLSAPFNSSLNYSESVAGGTGAPVPYTVSREGTINFPKLGVCVVEGMTCPAGTRLYQRPGGKGGSPKVRHHGGRKGQSGDSRRWRHQSDSTVGTYWGTFSGHSDGRCYGNPHD